MSAESRTLWRRLSRNPIFKWGNRAFLAYRVLSPLYEKYSEKQKKIEGRPGPTAEAPAPKPVAEAPAPKPMVVEAPAPTSAETKSRPC